MKAVVTERDPRYRYLEPLYRIVWVFPPRMRRQVREGGLDLDTAALWADQDRRATVRRAPKRKKKRS